MVKKVKQWLPPQAQNLYTVGCKIFFKQKMPVSVVNKIIDTLSIGNNTPPCHPRPIKQQSDIWRKIGNAQHDTGNNIYARPFFTRLKILNHDVNKTGKTGKAKQRGCKQQAMISWKHLYVRIRTNLDPPCLSPTRLRMAKKMWFSKSGW